MLALHAHDPRPLPVAYPGGANPALIQVIADSDCIKLKPGQTYPFILGEVGKTVAGTGLDISISEKYMDQAEMDEANIPKGSQPIAIPKIPAVGALSRVSNNPGVMPGSFFGSSVNGSSFDSIAAAIVAQNAAIIEQNGAIIEQNVALLKHIIEQNNRLLQMALQHDQQIEQKNMLQEGQQIVISPPH